MTRRSDADASAEHPPKAPPSPSASSSSLILGPDPALQRPTAAAQMERWMRGDLQGPGRDATRRGADAPAEAEGTAGERTLERGAPERVPPPEGVTALRPVGGARVAKLAGLAGLLVAGGGLAIASPWPEPSRASSSMSGENAMVRPDDASTASARAPVVAAARPKAPEALPGFEPARPEAPADLAPASAPAAPASGPLDSPRVPARGVREAPPGTPADHAAALTKVPIATTDRPPVGGVGASGIHVDRVAMGTEYSHSRCGGQTDDFSIEAGSRVNVCFRVVHPRQEEEVTVLWRKVGGSARRTTLTIPAMHAYRTRAYLVLRREYAGPWIVQIFSSDGVELANQAFDVIE